MKRVGAILAIGFGCAALVAAQTPTGQAAGSAQTTTRSDKSNTITLIGCLQHGDGSSTTGTTGTSGGATTTGAPPSRTPSPVPGGASFILTNAMAAPASGSTSAGTTGASSRPASSGKTYILEGGSSDLAKDVEKKVEVTGTIDASSSGSSSTATSTSLMASAQKLRVSSVRVVDSDCSLEKK